MHTRTLHLSAVAAFLSAALVIVLALGLAMTGAAAAQTPTPEPTATPAPGATGPLPEGGQGTLTVTGLPTGTDFSAPTVRTSQGCPTTSNAYNIRLTGPGGLDYYVTGRTVFAFSATDPFESPFGQTFKDAAALDTPPTTIVAGTYRATLNCVSGIVGATVRGTFVVDFVFDTPTSYAVSGAVVPTPTPGSGTPTPTPGSGSPTPTPGGSPTPSPTPGGSPTPSPTPAGSPTPAATATVRPSTTPTPVPAAGTGGATSAGTGGGTTGGSLAYTGAPVATLFTAGLAFTVLGAGLLIAARRRRPG